MRPRCPPPAAARCCRRFVVPPSLQGDFLDEWYKLAKKVDKEKGNVHFELGKTQVGVGGWE